MKALALFTSLCVLVLASCGGQDEPAISPGADQLTERPMGDEDQDGSQGLGLPGGVEFEFPYEFRNSEVFTNDSGAQRRRVTLEYVDASEQEILTQVEQAFAQAGFEIGERRTHEGGKIRVKIYKPEFGGVFASVLPLPASAEANPARGRLVLDWDDQ